MRRTVVFTAGLMIAAGTSLALAGPAAAAPDLKRPAGYHNPGFYNPRTSNPAAPYLSSFKPVNVNVVTQVMVANNGNVQIGNGNQQSFGPIIQNATSNQLNWLGR